MFQENVRKGFAVMPINLYFEYGLYSFLNLLPYMLIALYPVRNKLKISNGATLLIVIFLCVLEWFSSILVTFNIDTAIVYVALLITQIVFYCLVVKQPIGKSLFLLIALANIASFIEVIAKFAEGQFFPELAVQQNRWSFSVCIIGVQLCVLIPLFLYIKRYYTPIMERDKTVGIWRLLWLIPFTLYFVWYIYMFMSDVVITEIFYDVTNIFIQAAFVVGFLVTHHALIHMIDILNKNARLNEKEHQYVLQLSKYNILNEHVDDIKKSRHDLRHHLNVISSYAKDEKTKELLEYINSYDKALNEHTTAFYCDNYPVNSLIGHFATRADNAGVRMRIRVSLPENTPFSNDVLTVIFGNLLENAIEAAELEGQGSEIDVGGYISNGFLYIHVNNTCTKELEFDKEGYPISDKSSREIHGIGLRSVGDTVTKYNGIIEITLENNVFSVRIMLPIK